MTTFTCSNPAHHGARLSAVIFTALLITAGCSSDDNKPLSSENSKFSNSNSNAGVPGESDPAADLPKTLSGPIEIPSGDASAMLTFIAEITSLRPTSPEEAMSMAKAVLEASDKALDDTQATEEQRRRAADSKLNALQAMSKMQVPGIREMVVEYAKQLSIDKDPHLIEVGRTILFGFTMQSIMNGENKDYESFKQQALQWLEGGSDSRVAFDLVHQAALTLNAVEHEEDAAEVFQALGTTYKDSSNKDLAKEALNFLQLAEVFRADLDIKLEDMALKGISAYPPIKESITHLLAMENPGGVVFSRLKNVAEFLERSNFIEQAMETYQALEVAYQDNPDGEIREAVDYLITRSIVRLSLVGKQVEVTGILSGNGNRINWADYKDQVVLLNFWAVYDESCLQLFPELLDQYQQYHEKGFEIIGVNLDDNPQMLDAFNKEGIQEVLQIEAFPWATITTTDPDQRGFDTPLAASCGVSSLPSSVLIGRDGVVVATNVGGDALKKILIRLLQDPDSEPAESPQATPSEDDNSGLGQNQLFSSLAMLKRFATPLPWSTSFLRFAEGEEGDDGDNPYRAPAGLSALELVDYLLEMLEKPVSIRRRPGFGEAVSEAADRLLASETSDRYHVIAVESKVQVLHELASLGNKKANAMLVLLIEKLKDDKRPRIAAQVRFLQMEQGMLKIDDLPLAQLAGTLDAVQQYLAGEKLLKRHLRIASATVHGINRIEDPEQKEKYFQAFGKLFATSTDKTLASYGRKISSSPSSRPSDLVGKPLELEGETELGVALDWKSYRGKVVLIDFWATWCVPCLREMPNVRAIHKRLEKQGFTVLAVNLDRDQQDLVKFLEENDVPWTNLVTEGARQAATRYGVRSIPTMMVIDQQGKVAAVANRVAEVTGTIEKLLEKPEQK